METLMKRACAPYIPFMITFACFGLLGSVIVGDPDFVVCMALMLPCWASGPVLFTDTRESDAFLRTLPITRVEILTSRFLLSLIQLSSCWIIMAVVAAVTTRTWEDFMACVNILAVSAGVSLLVAGLSHLWVSRKGPSIPLGLVMNVLSVIATLAYVTTYAGNEEQALLEGVANPLIGLVVAMPWFVGAVLFVMALWTYLVLMKASTTEPFGAAAMPT